MHKHMAGVEINGILEQNWENWDVTRSKGTGTHTFRSHGEAHPIAIDFG